MSLLIGLWLKMAKANHSTTILTWWFPKNKVPIFTRIKIHPCKTNDAITIRREISFKIMHQIWNWSQKDIWSFILIRYSCNKKVFTACHVIKSLPVRTVTFQLYTAIFFHQIMMFTGSEWQVLRLLPCVQQMVHANPLHPSNSIHILHTVLCTFTKVLKRRICQTIESFISWWLFPLFSWHLCVIQWWSCKEKLDASRS